VLGDTDLVNFEDGVSGTSRVPSRSNLSLHCEVLPHADSLVNCG